MRTEETIVSSIQVLFYQHTLLHSKNCKMLFCISVSPMPNIGRKKQYENVHVPLTIRQFYIMQTQYIFERTLA